MILGLFENNIGFNEKDEYIFDVYFKDVDNLEETINLINNNENLEFKKL